MSEFNEKVMHMLGEIKGKQDLILENQEKQNERIESTEARIQKVEKKVNYAAGGLAAAVTIIGAILAKAVDLFKILS